MIHNTIIQRLLSDKKVLIFGFFFGVVIAPLLAALGMMSAYLEFLKPLFTGPMLLMGSFIPDIQTEPNTFEVPIYKWILSLGFNGICFALVGVLILSAIRKIKPKTE
jgi:hypothetical protein